ncbi:efflux transporter outer membrane subunit [Paracidovorax valerianellae]|uniref:Efflux transporter, outer membrane factor (OMF) lipoprotein, NodT family n=1 Tax=Paracidovorax valerianellae TaxID=187868 RepID=A0A1G6LSY4_9BURK|nr:efflux transporter outer membrane subunit [Paracidovorax valerianellae]MDA8446166.1 efflux transporter outer membrane subunit [Paracidovorax valerianellae]SDC46319.1 efflux transporter, outer membrane factor (OMF) lipoprotein, NodT family [Paracidovorax valerianellae]
MKPAFPFIDWAPRAMRLACLGALLPLAACSVAPVYQRPELPSMPTAFKEVGALWQPAAPADAIDRGDWWTLFQDDDLNRLAAQVQLSNQNIAAAVAAYAQAQALVREQRAGLLPSVSLSGSGSRAGGEGSARRGTTTQAALGADWAPDLWGRLGGAVDNASANAQASEADLASARLSAVGSLVSAYFQLREADAEIDLLQATVQGYERSLQIAQNRYSAGVVANSDVLQARTQLANARADLATMQQNRARYEHAIAVLTGVAPASFSLPPAPWVMRAPEVPAGIPSTLLQRRPDIAAAERAVAAANAQIGVQRSAYYPSLSLTASLGRSGTSVGDLFSASGALWSLGLSVAQTVFDGGAIAARVEGAEAARDARAATYRQTVLTAFQDVEDQLTVLRTLQAQEPLRQEAVSAANLTEQQLLNRYREGQVSYTEVVTAQVTALSARRALLLLQVNRQLAAATLVQALGGGWHAPWEGGAVK